VRSTGTQRENEGPEALETSRLKAPPVVARPPFWRRHRWLVWLGGAALVVLAAASALLGIAARRFEPYLRARIVEGLGEHFHTRVELDSFHVAVEHGEGARFGLWATGRGLRIWPPHRTGGDHPLETAVESLPLIQLQEFSFHVPLRLGKTQLGHIPEVRLKGLAIHVPPRSERDRKTGLEPAMDAQARPEEKPRSKQGAEQQGMLAGVVVERVVCEQAELVLEAAKPDKLPLTFRIAHLKLTHVTAGEAMQFEAELTNARPKGQIDTSGSFGPWEKEDPGESPVSGKYTFQHADLSDFNGIAGMLSSNGKYGGTLHALTVDGETMVPDFRLTKFEGKLPLHTTFHARVDGTEGDTWLDRVDATLGNSRFVTAGKVVRVKLEGSSDAGSGKTELAPTERVPRAGHVIDMKVDVPHGDMADFLRLVSKTGTPLMTGVVMAKATLHIAPGKEPVHERMELDGSFKLEGARFTSDKIQSRVEDLSFRGQGRPDDMKFADPKSVASEMQGSFHMANGVITLPDLKYEVPGAQIGLQGTYSLTGELHFDGTARMQATVSQMVGGWKGYLLKPADRFFKKDGAGALVPIRVRGTRDAPDFGVDLGRMNETHPERPGEK